MERQGIRPAPDSAALRFLYGKPAGRALLKLAASRPVSQLAGRFMDSPLSRPLIRPFASRNKIRMADYIPLSYPCFNDFFCRPIRKELRPIAQEDAAFMAPCDGYLSAYRITDGLVLPIKQSSYTIPELLGGDPAAEAFRDGICLVFRLCVQHYHRYAYVDDGRITGGASCRGSFTRCGPSRLRRFRFSHATAGSIWSWTRRISASSARSRWAPCWSGASKTTRAPA